MLSVSFPLVFASPLVSPPLLIRCRYTCANDDAASRHRRRRHRPPKAANRKTQRHCLSQCEKCRDANVSPPSVLFFSPSFRKKMLACVSDSNSIQVHPIWRKFIGSLSVNIREGYFFLWCRRKMGKKGIRSQTFTCTCVRPSREHQYCLSLFSRKSISRIFSDYWHAP